MNQVTATGAVKCPELKYFTKQHSLGKEFRIILKKYYPVLIGSRFLTKSDELFLFNYMLHFTELVKVK